MKLILCSLIIVNTLFISKIEALEVSEKMQWFRDAKYGLFIHWGVYAVPAGEYKGKKVPFLGEHIYKLGKIPRHDYQEMASEFNPQKFDAHEWVKLAKDCGFKYITITAKHHDGFALFDSAVTKFDIVDATPFKRDIIKELAEACRDSELKLCFYYSHAQDWYERHANNPVQWQGQFSQKELAESHDFTKYMNQKALPQIKELLTKYGDIAMIWFDTPYNITEQEAQVFSKYVRSLDSRVIINSRIGPGGIADYHNLGDNEMPSCILSGKDWEMVGTMNHTWGYKKDDHHWKSSEMLLKALVECASRGGNYMLNVGPKADGTIPQESITRLKTIGQWLKRHGETVYGTEASPFHDNFPWGYCTKKGNKLFLHIADWPRSGEINLPGFESEVESIRMHGFKNQRLLFEEIKTEDQQANLRIKLPWRSPESPIAVVELNLKGALKFSPKLIQDPEGNLSLPASRGSILSGESGKLNIELTGITSNFTSETGSLKWEFELTKAGKYKLDLYTNRHWRRQFPSGMIITLKNHLGQKQEIELIENELLDDITRDSYPTSRSYLGEIVCAKPTTYSIEVAVKQLGQQSVRYYTGEHGLNAMTSLFLKKLQISKKE